MSKNYTYILRCKDGTLYTGWTNDPVKRVIAHNSGKGAKYTKPRLPVYITYIESFDTKEEAMSREWHIKQLSHEDKEELIRKSGVVQLRPHHLLCIQLFEGKGYSPEFTDNMYSVIDRLDSNPNIMLTKTCDTLCSKCPYSKGSICETEEKILLFDNNVLAECDFTDGQIIEWEKAKNTAYKKILKKGIIEKVCVDCSWKEICYSKVEREIFNK